MSYNEKSSANSRSTAQVPMTTILIYTTIKYRKGIVSPVIYGDQETIDDIKGVF